MLPAAALETGEDAAAADGGGIDPASGFAEEPPEGGVAIADKRRKHRDEMAANGRVAMVKQGMWR